MRTCLFVAAAALALAACRPSRTFDVQGRIAGFSDDGRTVFVEHEAIEGLMDAMTMPFKLIPGDSLPESLATGDAVGFTLHVADSSWITGLARVPDSEVAISPSGENHLPTGRAGRGGALPLAIGEEVPSDLALVDHTGAPFTFGAERGHVVVVSFLYTRCPLPDYCPALASRMARIERAAHAAHGDRVRFVSVTLDPAFDTAPVLARWRATFTDAPASRWRFATGDTARVTRAIDLFGVYNERTGPSTLDHGLTTALVAPDGHLRRTWRDLTYTDADVLREIDLILADPASAR